MRHILQSDVIYDVYTSSAASSRARQKLYARQDSYYNRVCFFKSNVAAGWEKNEIMDEIIVFLACFKNSQQLQRQ